MRGGRGVRKCRVGLFGEKKGYQKEDLFETIFFRTLLQLNICFRLLKRYQVLVTCSLLLLSEIGYLMR